MFDGTAFCPGCGARRSRAGTGEAAARCPDCSRAMRKLQVGATALLECDGCDGIWADGETFEELCADREAQAAVLHQYADRAEPSRRVKYRPCVRCGKMMNRVNFARISGVVVDVCKGHGTFLDPGELHAIVRFIHGGGLERARSRQLEDLREREKRAVDAERRLARDRGRSDVSDSRHSWLFLIGHDG
jgi:Zn-finger nucleic acid-binding protein